MQRRTLMKSALLAGVSASLPRFSLAMASADKVSKNPYHYILTAEAAQSEIVPGTTSAILGFDGAFPAPIIRAKQGEPLRVEFHNKLDKATTIHWHGIRLPNEMDGVPWLTQKPIQPGERFVYEFTPPDAGTFWYHPHMHSIEQLSMGLVGALIIEEREPQGYHDVILGMKDWRLKQDGSYLPLSLPREAFRAGTLGTVATINGLQKPVIEVPAGKLLRLRFLNMDNTRVFNLSLGKTQSDILAIDGSPLAKTEPLHVAPTGAGMRLDVALQAPQKVGEEIPVYDMKGRFGSEIARLKTVASSSSSKKPAPIKALPANPIPKADLATAEQLNFVFEWQGALSPSSKQGKVDHSFWLINRRAWEGAGPQGLPAPLAKLEQGKSYVVDLHNATPHHHPIHLHGLIFTVMKSDKREITPYETDTILMEKNERAQIAFVADNPGKWMFHCHVIEHMKTGLMGYIEIS
jgi:FtsP/CotA-like multicopper oxidase with cupredoxin domain